MHMHHLYLSRIACAVYIEHWIGKLDIVFSFYLHCCLKFTNVLMEVYKFTMFTNLRMYSFTSLLLIRTEMIH